MWLYAVFVGAVPVGSPPERFHHISFEYNGRLLRATNHDFFHETRITRDDVVILSLLPRSGI